MKIRLLALVICLPLFSQAQPGYSQYVNPFIGTGGHGHTYPGATVPFGMVQLSPDTRKDGSWDGCGGYYFNDSLILGFSHTHLSGTGCSDYGDVLLMPVKNHFSANAQTASRFSHSSETAKPGYYSVMLSDPMVLAEMTATDRVGIHQYTFRASGDSATIMIDLRHRDKVLNAQLFKLNDRRWVGFRYSSAWAKDQRVYFCIEFSEPVIDEGAVYDSLVHPTDYPKLSAYSGNIATGMRFKLPVDRRIVVKVALSSVSIEGAIANLKKEAKDWGFEELSQQAVSRWNIELGKIEVNDDNVEALKVFYSALYHCMIVPNIYNDVDGRYLGRDLKVHKSSHDYYTVFSLWDTFRAWHPLMTLIDRKRTLNYVLTFLDQYKQGGMLPVWELSSNETECMIGYHSVSVIADAFAKGISDFDTKLALDAMQKSARTPERFGLKAFMDHRFLDVLDESESVSKTLEYSYDDWCIANFAERTGNKAVAEEFYSRSNSWKNLFDPETGFIRPRKNGRFLDPFNPREVNNNFTEANAWQYTFFMPQDIVGLADRLGGTAAFEKKLDQLFSEDSKTTGREQADISGLIGQYAHGNEPSHHMAYLYNYTSSPWKTQYYVDKIRQEFYSNAADGLIGNEDCGQMSAWLVLSALGLYQICPGDPHFELTTPMFREITIHMDNGKELKIVAPNLTKENRYIESVALNGGEIFCPSYEQLSAGGELVFKLSTARNKWNRPGVQQDRTALNKSINEKYLSAPVVRFPSELFKESINVALLAPEGSSIKYSLNNSPEQNYSTPFEIRNSDTLKTYAVSADAAMKSSVVTTYFHKQLHPDWKISIHSQYNPQYTAGGDDGIIDGMHGDADWRKGAWQGYQGQNFEAVIDFGKVETVSSFYGNFLQDTRSWILMPKNVTFEVSDDGVNFHTVVTATNSIQDTVLTNTLQKLGGKTNPVSCRYVKIHSDYYGQLPSWHPGAGGESFIFIDEIEIN